MELFHMDKMKKYETYLLRRNAYVCKASRYICLGENHYLKFIYCDCTVLMDLK